MKHILTLIFISTLAVTTIAQTIDDDRMHRDLEVAENALGTTLTPNSDDFPRWNVGDKDIEAGYIKDYGVVFMVNSNGLKHYRIYGDVNAKGKKAKSKQEKKEGSEKEKNLFIENSKTFLADYASIIGQLKDDHRISIRRGGGNSNSGHYDLENIYIATTNDGSGRRTIWSNNGKSQADSELIIETTVGEINALRKGSISRDAFFKSVSVIENVISYEKDADLETLSAMFQRLYKKDLSSTYYSEREPKYSKLSNFGVIIKMKFYSSYEDDNVYSMPTISKEGLTLEERNNHVMELLPQFESDFKDNLVNYGRTLKGLDSEEIIMFEINMTTCKDCKDFPRTMKFSVKKSVLHKYNRGELSLKQATDMVNVDRILE